MQQDIRQRMRRSNFPVVYICIWFACQPTVYEFILALSISGAPWAPYGASSCMPANWNVFNLSHFSYKQGSYTKCSDVTCRLYRIFRNTQQHPATLCMLSESSTPIWLPMYLSASNVSFGCQCVCVLTILGTHSTQLSSSYVFTTNADKRTCFSLNKRVPVHSSVTYVQEEILIFFYFFFSLDVVFSLLYFVITVFMKCVANKAFLMRRVLATRIQ